MLVTLAGILTLWSPVQLSKHKGGIDSTPSPTVIFVRLVQPEKAWDSASGYVGPPPPMTGESPHSMTLPGIARLVRLVQPPNAKGPMYVMLSGSVRLRKLLQAQKDHSPIAVTLVDIVDHKRLEVGGKCSCPVSCT